MSTTPFVLIPTGPSDPQQLMDFISGNNDIRHFHCLSRNPDPAGLFHSAPCFASEPAYTGAVADLRAIQSWAQNSQPRSFDFQSGMMVGALAMLLLVLATNWWRRRM